MNGETVSLQPAEEEIGSDSAAARIDAGRLIWLLLITLLSPLLLGIGIDIGFGSAPMATVVLGFLAIPLSTVLVLRAALAEFNGVVRQVAPENLSEELYTQDARE